MGSRDMACRDHLGNEFVSHNARAAEWGLKANVVNSRLKSGWSLERALITPRQCEVRVIKDHLGYEFKTRKEMCAKYGIRPQTFVERLKNGFTLEGALTAVKDTSVIYKGEKFDSLTELCKTMGVSASVVQQRLRSGWSLVDALKRNVKSVSKSCVCPLGVQYESIVAMCRNYGVRKDVFARRLKVGWSFREALGLDVRKGVDAGLRERAREIAGISWGISKGVKAPDGVVYASMKEMCDVYGVENGTFYARVCLGWSLSEALGLNGRGLDVYLYRGEQLNALLEVMRVSRERMSYGGRDGRRYYRVVVRETGQVLFRNSDQILEFKG
jgi:hypothetical protein